MKHVLLLLLFLTASTLTAFSQKTKIESLEQKKEDNGWLGFSIGGAFPAGAIANTDMTDSTSGFASSGLHLNVSMGYTITGPVGVCVMYQHTSNDINGDAYRRSLSQYIAPGIDASYELGSWKSDGLMAGFFLKSPSNGGPLSIYVRGLAGFASVKNPEIKIVLTKQGYYPATISTESKTFTSFSYSFGLGINLRINEYVRGMVNCDFLSTTPTMKDIKTTYTNTKGPPYTISPTYSQPYSVIAVTAGMAWVLP